MHYPLLHGPFLASQFDWLCNVLVKHTDFANEVFLKMVQISSMVTDFVNQSNNLDFVPLSDSELSPEQISDLKIRVRDLGRGYRMRNTDFKIFDALKRLPGIDSEKLTIVHDVITKHPEVTKCFKDSVRTFDSIRHYGEKSTRKMTYLRAYRVARSILNRTFNGVSLSPLKISQMEDIQHSGLEKSTSSGAIARGSKGKNWETIRSVALKMQTQILSGKPFNQIWIPAMPFHRSQLHDLVLNGKFNPNYVEKDRLIWGVDASTVLLEACYARPLIEWTKDGWFNYAGGKQPQVLRSYIAHSTFRRNYWYSTDYSKFDQTIPDWLIHDCFNVVRSLYDPSEWRMLNWIEYNFINTKLVIPGGLVVQVHKGIPSGSYFTQIIGSMANELMMLTYLASRELNYSDTQAEHLVEDKLSMDGNYRSDLRMFTMGDDNLFFYTDKLDLNDLASYVHHVFGVKINADKTVQGRFDPPKFLSRYWLSGGEDRDQLEMMLQLVLPERRRQYKNYTPYDILFSLWYTFRFAFKASYPELATWFANYFRDSGHSTQNLVSLPKSELPGSAKVFSKETLQNYVDFANSVAGIA